MNTAGAGRWYVDRDEMEGYATQTEQRHGGTPSARPPTAVAITAALAALFITFVVARAPTSLAGKRGQYLLGALIAGVINLVSLLLAVAVLGSKRERIAFLGYAAATTLQLVLMILWGRIDINVVLFGMGRLPLVIAGIVQFRRL